MSISPAMQERLAKIEGLIQQGYELKKKKLKDNPFFKFFNIETEYEEPFVSFKNSNGRMVNIHQKSPAGFSWIAFWFSPYLMVRIRDYSYFYWYALVATISAFVEISLNSNVPFSLLQLLIGWIFACQYPYLRYIAKSKNIKERGWTASICLTLIFSLVAAIPNMIITANVGG